MAPSPFTTTFDINTPISSTDMPDTVNPRDMTLADDVDSTPSESGTLATDTTSASPSNSSESMSKPAPKKRKKWGQVLPEPTTNLPPRKRAKTEEEKQQRKYERVKRNRQAAHNSRLRKQEEMDKLYAENNSLKQDLNNFRDEIARLQEENSRLQQQATQPRITTLASDMSPSIADFTFPSDIKHIKQEPNSNVLTPPDSPRSVIDASKQSNDTHSAEMWSSPQWTLDSPIAALDTQNSDTPLMMAIST